MPPLLTILPPAPIWLWVGVVCGIVALAFHLVIMVSQWVWARIGPTWRLRQRVTNWLVQRQWTLQTESSPNYYFALWAAELENPQRMLFISRAKDHKDILTFSARVGLDPLWLEPLSKMADIPKQVLVQDMGVFINTMHMGFGGLEWPLNHLAVQHAIPIDTNLSAFGVDLEAKKVLHAVLGTRRLIRKAIILSVDDIPDAQPGSAS